jgi:hypothetical protein
MIRTACDIGQRRGQGRGCHDIQACFRFFFNGPSGYRGCHHFGNCPLCSDDQTYPEGGRDNGFRVRGNDELSSALVDLLCNAGRLAERSGRAQRDVPVRKDQSRGSFGKNIQIIGGAIDISLQRQLTGKTLTLHPAVPIDEPLGPVKWVAGGKRPDGWSIMGEDHTTVETGYILKALQR